MSTPERARPTIDNEAGIPLHARNASLADLATMLKDQHTRKVDVVAPATTIRSRGALLVIDGAEPIITDEGVTSSAGTYRPTAVADEGIAEKLRVPVGFLKRLRVERPDLYDANVNGLLHGRSKRRADGSVETIAPADDRAFLVRAFRSDDGGVGVARAFLSDRYRIVDNLDVLTAALDGIRASGAEVEVTACDLTDRRMYVKVAAPGIAALAPSLLDGYRSPFGGQYVGRGWTPERVAEVSRREGQELDTPPVVFAGFVISNSETGGGAFTITPRLTVKVCDNGLTITADALRNVHLGGKLDEGVVRWSDETQQRNLDLVRSQATDAVRTFLDVDYLHSKVTAIEEQAAAPVNDAAKTVQHVAKALRFGEDAATSILDHFIRGGQPTAGGVLQAVTSYAQTLDDADSAAEVEGAALSALALAARG